MWSFQVVLYILSVALCCVSRAAGLIHVFGYEGGDVNVSCPYDEGYESNEKYMCKDPCGNGDVFTRLQNNQNKYSTYDEKTLRIFTVTISDLHLDDYQTYWCGVNRKGLIDLYTEVKLEVRKDRCCDTVNKTQSTEEGSVTISCPYDSQSVDKLKFFCRGNRPSTCLQQAVITSSNTQDGRFRLSDDRKSGIFTVTISSLTLKDSGSYLCGVQRNLGFDVFTAIELEVKELESYNISGLEGRPVTLQCPNSGQQHDNRKFLCKGDQHNNCTDMLSVSLFYILPAVFTLLLILTFVLFLVLKYKSRIKQVDGINVNVLNSADHHVEADINDVYELQENVVYVNSSTLNKFNDDDHNIYNNII